MQFRVSGCASPSMRRRSSHVCSKSLRYDGASSHPHGAYANRTHTVLGSIEKITVIHNGMDHPVADLQQPEPALDPRRSVRVIHCRIAQTENAVWVSSPSGRWGLSHEGGKPCPDGRTATFTPDGRVTGHSPVRVTWNGMGASENAQMRQRHYRICANS